MPEEQVKKERKPRPQGLSRTVSSRADKIAALQEIRRKCENGLIIRSAHIKNQYGVHDVLNKLLKEHIIVPNGAPHKYKWVSTQPIPEIVDAYWSLHGAVPKAVETSVPVPEPKLAPLDKKVMENIDVFNKSVKKKLDEAEERMKGTTSHPAFYASAPGKFTRLQGEIEVALQRCKEYGISNVSKYIADHLTHLGVGFSNAKGTSTEHLLH